MNILGIESSCDESAAALVKDGRTVLASDVASQFEHHEPFSGVVPELASRAHVLNVNRVIERVLSIARKKKWPIDAIAVTVGPGLVGSLLVGKITAEALGWALNKPVYGVNHIEGHLLSPVIENKILKPPFLGLVVSGGHTELILASRWGHYELIGRTRDDAAGEAFDKVAKMMDLGYPGGPVVDRLAKQGRADKCVFPRPWLPGTWDFSFSGLKTSALYKIRDKKKWSSQDKKDLCAGFQRSVVDVLVMKTIAAVKATKARNLVVGGGVAANSELRDRLTQASQAAGINLFIAPLHLCSDNAAMIASAAYYQLKMKRGKALRSLKVQPQLHIPFVSQSPGTFRPDYAISRPA